MSERLANQMAVPSDRGRASDDSGLTIPRHLYVHVPLCASRCSYCDFFSLTPGELGVSTGALVDGLVNQTRAWAERGLAVGGIDTLYVGGGTPTMLGQGLASLVSALAVWAEAKPDAEITVEANPDSLDPVLVELLAMAGVTRVSLGVQSFSDAELEMLGRRHNAARAREAAAAVVASGLELSVDLMCGLPAQGMETWRENVADAIGTGAVHVSVYPLSVETGTPLAASVVVGDVPEPDPDLTADQMLHAASALGAAGLARYEVANYARPGHESRHNTAYWTGAPYLGIGPGAHGMLDADTARATGFVVPDSAARVRYSVACRIESGIRPMPEVEVELLDAGQAAREDAMLGLRLTRGIDDTLAGLAGVREILKTLETDGLVARAGGRWATTERGWLLGNEVFGRIWTGA